MEEEEQEYKYTPDETDLAFQTTCRNAGDYITAASNAVFPCFSWDDFYKKRSDSRYYAALIAARTIRDFFAMYPDYNTVSWRAGGEQEYDDNNYYTTEACADIDNIRLDDQEYYDCERDSREYFLLECLAGFMHRLDSESLNSMRDDEAGDDACCRRETIAQDVEQMELNYSSWYDSKREPVDYSILNQKAE